MPFALPPQTPGPAIHDLVSFADAPNRGFLPVREVGRAFDWPVGYKDGRVTLNGRGLDPKPLRQMVDGTTLAPLDLLQSYGVAVGKADGKRVPIRDKKDAKKMFFARHGSKRVFVNKKEQTLVAFEGERKVLTTRVSTGRAGKRTPTGIFEAQAYKTKMHRSTLYDGAQMPWSVQIVGNIFIHGFESVPGRAASSGCIRVPLTNGNPARWFWYWIERGTPVTLLGKWPKNV